MKQRAAGKRLGKPRRTQRATLRRNRPERGGDIVLPATRGDEVDTTVERIVPGGLGLAYGGGRTLFVSRAAPGDHLRVRIDREQGRVAHAAIVEIIAPGPDRVPEPYPLLSRCGADFQHLRYDAQLAAKGAMIADSLRRIAGIDLSEPPVTPSPETWGYRARADWRHDPAQPALGYLESGSRRVLDVPEDPFVVPALAEQYARLRERAHAGRLPEWATELRAAAGDDGVSLAPPFDLPQPLPVHATVAGERFTFDADCFFQVNPFVLEDLVAEALRYAPEPGAPPDAGSRLAIDLYCGVGLFTVPLARRFERVIGVEGHPRAAEFAGRNAAAAGARNVQIHTAAVERWLDGAHRSHGRASFLLLDPPRTGLPPHGLRVLPRLRAARIAYVSCDPATLARDLKALLATGYELRSIAAFDMFPQTHHVEIVAHLQRAA